MTAGILAMSSRQRHRGRGPRPTDLTRGILLGILFGLKIELFVAQATEREPCDDHGDDDDWENDEHEAWARGAIVTSGLRFKVPEDAQGNFWEDRVV